ncbi:MAG: hypothetical protein VYC34_01855 [Planctomycetota bacterium]|nr:hypothetical protein [Planctomycetota bacterium]
MIRLLAAAILSTSFVAIAPAAPPLVLDLPEVDWGIDDANDRPTQLEIDRQRVREMLEYLRAAYAAHGSRNPAWDKKVDELFTLFAPWLVAYDHASHISQLREAARALIVDLECEDPLVRFAFAFSVDSAGHSLAAYNEFDQCTAELVEFGYPRSIIILAEAQFGRHLAHWQRREANAPWLRAGDMLVKAVQNKEFVGRAEFLRDILAAWVRGDMPAEIAESTLTRLEADPHTFDPYTRLVTRGDFHLRLAWDARGAGHARNLTGDQRRIFQEHLAAARACLAEAWDLDPEDPRAATLMITVAMADRSDEEPVMWFRRATRARIDAAGAAAAMRWALRPRWGGGRDEMYAFARACAASDRFDSNLPLSFINTMRAIVDDLRDSDYESEWIWREPHVRDAAVRVLTRLADEPAHAVRRDDYLAMLATVHWANQEYGASWAVLQRMAGPFPPSALPTLGIAAAPDDVICDSALVGGPISRQLPPVAGQHFEVRVDALRRLLVDGIEDPIARRAVKDRLVVSERYLEMQEGAWVDLTFDDDLSGWRAHRGRWRRIDDRTVEGAAAIERAASPEIALLLDQPVGDSFELKATLDITGQTSLWRNHRNISILTDHDSFARFRAFTFYPGDSSVIISESFRNRAKHECVADDAFQIHLKVWQDQVVVRVNGNLVYVGDDPTDETLIGNGKIGLAAHARYILGPIRFSNVSIRILSEMPTELAGPGF